MILIAEPVHFGATHVQVNSAFIALFKDVYATQKIQVFVEEKHINELKLKLANRASSINFESFKQYNGNPSFSWLRKIFGEWRQIFKVLLKAKKEQPELLVWLCLFPTAHLLLTILHRFFIPRQNQLIILHGELVYIGEKRRSRSEQFLKFFLEKALNWSNANTHYIVLGDTIKENLSLLQAKTLKKISVIMHPFLYPTQFKPQNNSFKPLKVCLFGALTIEKNAPFIFEMAKSFEKEIRAGQIQFTTFGKMQPNVQKYRNDLVNCHRPDEFLSQLEFEQQICKQHLALFFYDDVSYSLIASGALHEALSLQIPMIGLRNDYFAEVLNSFHVGEMADSLVEMERLLRTIMIQPEKKLIEYDHSIIMFLQQNSFLLQSEKLKNLLKAAGFLTTSPSASTND